MAPSSTDASLTTPLTPADCPAFILAGGRSSRFGSDKALLPVNGLPLLQQLQQQLLASGHNVRIVADRRERYAALGIECIPDELSGVGPLAGVIAAIRQRQESGAGWLLVLNCDLLIWNSQWFTELALKTSSGSGSTSNTCRAVHFVSEAPGEPPRTEPLPCLLHTSGLAEALAAATAGQLALQQLLHRLNAATVSSQLGPARWTFNTPAELAQRMLDCPHPG